MCYTGLSDSQNEARLKLTWKIWSSILQHKDENAALYKCVLQKKSLSQAKVSTTHAHF